MATEATTVAVPDRRQRYREFMKRFNPAAPAMAAIRDGLICQSPGRSVAKRIAARADLSPGCQQLLVGGIGSGKTTELMLAEIALKSQAAVLPLFVDVSAETDLNQLQHGALLCIVGIHLWMNINPKYKVPPQVRAAAIAIQRAAFGRRVSIADEELNLTAEIVAGEPDSLSQQAEGKLIAPVAPTKVDVVDLLESVGILVHYLNQKQREVIVIFDGLDRLKKADEFWTIVDQDLHAIKSLKLSLVAAGPLSIMYGPGRQIKDFLDEVYYLGPAIFDPDESDFLLEIMRLRGAGEFMSEAQSLRLCRFSGGVVRDLISLARNAGENAYLANRDHINSSDVDEAIQRIGISYLLGLGTEQRKLLHGILQGRGFSPTDSVSLDLLLSRRVLEQDGSKYQVHPALASVLNGGF